MNRMIQSGRCVNRLALLLGFFIVCAPIKSWAAGNGDIDNDGQATAADVNLIGDYVVGKIALSPSQLSSAEVNGDSKINVADAISLANRLSQRITIDVTPNSASWTLTGPSGFTAMAGTGDRLGSNAIITAPAGTYKLQCNALAGYATPLDISLALSSSGSIAFTPVYAPAAGTKSITLVLTATLSLEMISCPPGTFLMGRAPGELMSDANADYQHEVTITKPFYIGKFEVTKRQWTAVMGNAPWNGHGPIDSDPDSPAVEVNWNDIAGPGGFVDKLNEHLAATGQNYIVRLPTEAEWEYACRAGTTTRCYWGDDLKNAQLDTYEHVRDASGSASKVGQRKPNPWGLYDMSGNANEWCYDWMGGKYEAKSAVDPNGFATGTERVTRGGWFNCYKGWNSSSRGSFSPNTANIELSFRIALSPDWTPAIKSVSMNAFTRTTSPLPGVIIHNSGLIIGSGTGPIEYHWIVKKPNGVLFDSGPIKASLTNGYCLVGSYDGFPTDVIGANSAFIRVTAPELKDSPPMNYTVVPIPAVNMQMVGVPSGSFLMGRSAIGDDTSGAAAELPVHSVALGAYRIGKYEVTTEQFCAVLNYALSKGYLCDCYGNPYNNTNIIASDAVYTGGGQETGGHKVIEFGSASTKRMYFVDRAFYVSWAADHPVFRVTWYGAIAFCNWLSEKEGLTPCYDLATWALVAPNSGGYRLPMEAEWERAAGWDGTKHRVYPMGGDALTTYSTCNYDHYDPSGLGELLDRTSPVGLYNGVNIIRGNLRTLNSPSPVGCYDMAGNVGEWCQEVITTDYTQAAYDGGAWKPEWETMARVIRGGDWYWDKLKCRSAARSSAIPSYGTNLCGIRVVRGGN